MKMLSVAKAVYRNSGLKALLMERKFDQELAVWKRFASSTSAHAGQDSAADKQIKVLIVPPDPLYLTHSRGDQAMLTVVIDWIRQELSSEAEVHILTSGDSARGPAQTLGCKPVPLLQSAGAQEILDTIHAENFDYAFLIGADTVDGKLNPVFSQKMILATDAVRLSGGVARVLGFSYAKDRFARMGESFDQIGEEVRVHLRDPKSLARLAEDTTHDLVQVADLAFMLRPADVSDLPEAGWIAARKAEGRRVIGLNFNPMPFEGDRTQHDRAASVLADVLAEMAERENLAFLLVAHDFRHDNSDLYSLGYLADRMGGTEFSWASNTLHASQIKGLCALLDGVVTARMHFAIASLGAGTPVCVATYRNKFSGLLDLFGLGGECLLAPEDFGDAHKVQAQLTNFVAQLPQLAQTVGAHLPSVMDLSSENFAGMVPQGEMALEEKR